MRLDAMHDHNREKRVAMSQDMTSNVRRVWQTSPRAQVDSSFMFALPALDVVLPWPIVSGVVSPRAVLCKVFIASVAVTSSG
jgi:hypothetical protein